MNVLAAGPAARSERPASTVLHDHPHARIAGFHLLPGQQVPPHASESTVIVHVVSGSGTFRGADGEARLAAGESVVYEPGETHSMEAGVETLRFLAIITPRPGGRR